MNYFLDESDVYVVFLLGITISLIYRDKYTNRAPFRSGGFHRQPNRMDSGKKINSAVKGRDWRFILP